MPARPVILLRFWPAGSGWSDSFIRSFEHWAEHDVPPTPGLALASHVSVECLLLSARGHILAWQGIEAVPPRIHAYNPRTDARLALPGQQTRTVIVPCDRDQATDLWTILDRRVGDAYDFEALMWTGAYALLHWPSGWQDNARASAFCSELTVEALRGAGIEPFPADANGPRRADNATPAALEWSTRHMLGWRSVALGADADIFPVALLDGPDGDDDDDTPRAA